MPPAASHPGQTIRQQAKGTASSDRASQNRDVVKPVLANPFTVPWPTLPNHLQASILAALPQIIPTQVADYHVSRARCSRAIKRERRKEKRAAEADPGPSSANTEAPTRPDLLDQLVFGLNETIKALETGIDDLRFRMMIMSDALEGKVPATSRFLPTAPVEAKQDIIPESVSPLAFVLVPNLSVSPQALIDPLPMYCATYNSLLRQHSQLAEDIRKRLPRPEKYISEEGPEIRLVPLGRREAEIAAIVGLRRVSTFAIRDHPNLEALERLLPKSVLAPPRHSMTLPFPTSSLKVHSGEKTISAPVPTVHYPPLHVKAVHTTAPVDNNSRKTQRLIEVRKKRVESKEKRRLARVAFEHTVAADIKASRGCGGRAARIAAKHVKMNVDVC